MRRETPSAKLFGELLTTIRLAGTGSSMRRIAERIGTPSATVSQVERGQRALKQPKIAAWAEALEVPAADLEELWHLSQGQVRLKGGLGFYRKHPEALGALPSEPRVTETVQRHPDLEPIYRLTAQIVDALGRMVPGTLDVEPRSLYWDPPIPEGPPTDDERSAMERWEAEAVLPLIECRTLQPKQEHWGQFGEGQLVEVPLIEELPPIVRRRTTSVAASDLEELIRDLSGPERERVRGYVEAMIEGRSGTDS